MSIKKNKQVVHEYIENIINTGVVKSINNYLSPDYSEVHNNRREKIGIEGAKERVQGYRNTYPDFKVTVDQQIAEGDWVATCCTISGTHLGVWMDIKPTGKKIKYTAVIVDKIINGKIVEHGGAVNLFDSLLENGLIHFVKQ